MQDVFLRTERLALRRLRPDDAERLFELDSDPEVLRYIDGGRPPDLARIRDEKLPALLALYDRPPGLGFWAAVERGSGRFLGWFHFRPDAGEPDANAGAPDRRESYELGYRLRRDAWGRGLATEGSRALLDRGFDDFGVRRVVARAMAANAGSRRVMEKLGMRLVARYEDARYPGPDRRAVLYRIDVEERSAGF